MDYSNQYTMTSYGAQGGAGGGGFIPGGSQNSPSGATREYGNETLRPVTIKQVLDAEQKPDSEFSLDGSRITQITLIGQVRNISTQTTNVTYKLDDGTGTLEVKQWIDSDAPTGLDGADSSKPKIVDNAYVRVWGKIKDFNNRRHVGAHVIRPIADYNEISYHLLEATVVHLYFTRGPPDAAAGKGGQGLWRMAPLPNGTSAAARKVYEVLKNSPQSNEGLHMQDIAGRGRMDMAETSVNRY
ncbi:Replication factor A protein 2 [Coniosporium tulheliwenetii]|uniref:Replication factor A protein 2 n=1 Tax=Coniosporium tulheliwenetii TaxID=3383036 RepID=A0ACC2ZJQ2_9PEZI|nr:Replication factor A protein 2 [Cladosporium sp. JES 115]